MSPRPDVIQVFRPWYGQEEIDAVQDVLASCWPGLGPKTGEFEDRFSTYVGASRAAAVSSGTAALHLACMALGLGPGDEVIVPTLTFVATAHAVSYCGATPVFVDVEPDTLNIDVECLGRAVTPRTRAAIVVHYGGHACRMEEIWDLADDHGFPVIEDAAHACGSTYRGERIGGLERTALTCFSFFATKNLAVGDGGMVTTNDPELAHAVRRLRWMGIEQSTWERTGPALSDRDGHAGPPGDLAWSYEVRELGYKYQMTDLSAALGLVQLAKLDAGNERRRVIAERYTAALAGSHWLRTPVELPYTRSSLHNYVVKTAHRERLRTHLAEAGIQTSVHYLPVHLQPYYRQRRRVELPIAETVWTTLLTLPLHPGLTDEQVDRVIGAVLELGEGIEEER